MGICLYKDILAVNIDTVWKDKKTYPCAVIATIAATNYLYLLSTEAKYKTGGTLGRNSYLVPLENGKILSYNAPSVESGDILDIENIEWVFSEEKDLTAAEATIIMAKPEWSSFDLYNEDGTLYLAASDPIPILAPTIEPLSMWLGWKAGNWVARQRGKKAVEEETDNGLGDSFPITFSVPDVLKNTSFAYDDSELRYYKISNMIPTADELASVTIAAEIIASEGSVSYNEIYGFSSTNDVGHLVAVFGSTDYGFVEFYLVIPKNSDGYEPGFYILNDGKGIWKIEDATIQITMSKSE